MRGHAACCAYSFVWVVGTDVQHVHFCVECWHWQPTLADGRGEVMLLAQCDVWDYADMCTDDIVGIELGIHTFHRKLPRKEEEHPIIRESRRRAERMDRVRKRNHVTFAANDTPCQWRDGAC
jgi:hypothetical protein